MRLIDADKLPKYTGYALSADEVAMAVENAPTIDAEPVRHGKWEYAEDEVLDDLTFSAWKCSRCGYYAYQPELWHYCPRCGAKMEGETG